MVALMKKVNNMLLQQTADALIEEGLIDPSLLPQTSRHPERDAVRVLLDVYGQTLTIGRQRVMDEIRSRSGAQHAAEFERDPAQAAMVKNTKAYDEWFSRQGTMQEFFAYSSDQMQEMYDIALDLFDHGDIDGAGAIFFYLAYLNPNVGWFWQGIGDCWRQKGDLPSAQYMHAVAINTDPMNVDFYHSAGEALIQNRDYDKAVALFEWGIEQIDPRHPNVREVREYLMSGLEHFRLLAKKK